MRTHSQISRIALALVAMVMISACTSPAADPKQYEELVGLLAVVRITDTSEEGEVHPTEYRLTVEGEDPVYLTSDAVKLDKFINDTIRVEGYFADVRARIFQVMIAEEVTDVGAEEAQMTEYTSNDLGVAFTHHSTWKVRVDGTSALALVDAVSDMQYASLEVSDMGDSTKSEWIAGKFPGKETEDIVVGNVAGIKVLEPTGAKEVTVFTMGKRVYTLKFLYGGGNVDIANRFAQMKSSLQFFVPGSATLKLDEMDVLGETEKEPVTPVQGAQDIAAYMTKQGAMLPGDGEKTISQVEVAEGGYVYVTYTAGSTPTKVLYAYSNDAGGFALTQVGLFEKGEREDWLKLSGENKAKDAKRDVYTVKNGSVEMKSTVTAGQSLYENSALGFALQYPRNWYYAGENISAEGGLQRITFTDAPQDANPTEKVTVSVFGPGKKQVSGESMTVGGKQVTVFEENGVKNYAYKAEDGRLYVVAGQGEDTSTEAVAGILQSIDVQ